ncbi:polyphosphate kinase 1 [Tellurirhabdus bombi]|uniref:polyphosphate kinase 1 n=1 Tax=Tellurirhabdus bombi TaxID=2907205 RepID=UPI001F214EA9|nr:polyphosphate kinase 1 [Tellurirhabdus bombi]
MSTKYSSDKSDKKGSFGNLFSFLSSRKPIVAPDGEDSKAVKISEKLANVIDQSNYISRDLSWLKFNDRVLDQAKNPDRNLFDRLKFLAITASNLDEFFTIRVGSLYNYLDYNKERIDYSGLREIPFRKALLKSVQQFSKDQRTIFAELKEEFSKYDFQLAKLGDLTDDEREQAIAYFDRTIYPMLTPMVYDYTHTFPVLLAKVLIFGVVTHDPTRPAKPGDEDESHRLSFVQLPANLPRFLSFERDEELLLLPIEEVVRQEIRKLYRNIEILSVNLFRMTRNGDFTLEESDDIESDFIDEIKQKIKNRRLGRVVRVEMEPGASEWMINLLKKRWEIDEYNLFENDQLIDYTSLWQIIRHPEFRDQLTTAPPPVPALGYSREKNLDIFDVMKERDILLHHPYNNFEPVLSLLEEAAEDPNVLSIKLTVYRLAKNSRVTEALLKAAENGKHVSVLFEVKARFDEENNIREAQRLQKAGCFVIYGISKYKTHTKLLLVVRNEGSRVVQYAHLSSGNYNEDTAKLYTDIGLLTTDQVYTRDISEFFNVITGHSLPSSYQYLITAPRDMRKQLIKLIQGEAENAMNGLPSGICIKLNSLEDKHIIDELYKASQAGVPIQLIVRGICCLRPGRQGLSENIAVRSIVGDFLEHTRLFYFHNNGDPKVYGGSADVMVRSFDRRIESLFLLVDERVKQQAIHILSYNLQDNINTYVLREDGYYEKCCLVEGVEEPFDIHKKFFEVTDEEVMEAHLFANIQLGVGQEAKEQETQDEPTDVQENENKNEAIKESL